MKKKLFSAILILAMLLSLVGCGNSQTEDLVILYTNDVHCAVDSGMGYAGLSALKKQYEAQGLEVILADCGDAIQGAPIGTLSEGEYIIDIMNQVGYDVAIMGNHEFDYGSARFMELADLANYPYVSCNFRSLETGETVLEPYTMLNRGGVQIAFLGVTTPNTLVTSAPAYFMDESGNYIYSFDQDSTGELLFQSVQSAIDAAKKEGADYIIALSHLGIGEESAPWSSSDLIANTSGLDVVLDGHSHSEIPCTRQQDQDGNWVLLSQTGSKFASVGMLLIEKNGSISTGLIDEFDTQDSETAAYIQNLQQEFEETLQTVVAQTEVELTIYDPDTGDRIIRTSETNLGDLCADAYRTITGADVAIVNGGGIRESIAAGAITFEDILTVQPFGNEVCLTEATGQDILDALELGACEYPNESGAFLQVSGLTYELHSEIESSVVLDENGMFAGVDGPYRVQNVLIDNKPLELDHIYTLASHSYYIKDCGEGMNMFLDNTLLLDSIMADHQALIEYLTINLNGVVDSTYENPYGQGRISIFIS